MKSLVCYCCLLLGIFQICLSPEVFAQQRLAKKNQAIFIAVTDYDHWDDLRNPIKDSKDIASELKTNFDFDTTILSNPTRNEIYQVLKDYQNQTFAEDGNLFIFFSGHGTFIDEASQGYFIPKNGSKVEDDPFQDTYVPLNRIKGMVNNIPCKHVLLLIDACYSGTIDEKIAMKGSSSGKKLKELGDEQAAYIESTKSLNTRLFLTSGGKERTPDGLNNSPFTEKLLETLRYGVESKLITFTDMLSIMEKASPTPHWGEFGSHEDGADFILVNTTSFVDPAKQTEEGNNTEEGIQSLFTSSLTCEEVIAQQVAKDREKFDSHWKATKNLGKGTIKQARAYLKDFTDYRIKQHAENALQEMRKILSRSQNRQKGTNWLTLGNIYKEMANKDFTERQSVKKLTLKYSKFSQKITQLTSRSTKTHNHLIFHLHYSNS